MRQKRPHAFNQLVLTSPVAARIASHAGLDNPHQPRRKQPTPEEIANVEASRAAAVAQLVTHQADAQLGVDKLTGLPIRTAHLSPQALDAINPLPNGRKRSP